MSENELGTLCDEEKMLAYIYDDVDDSDIFAIDPLNNSFTETDPKADTELQESGIAAEIIKEKEALEGTVEKLQKEKEILELRISELYKTARAELDRKDRRLKDLEKEKDNILFRRGNFVRKKLPDSDPKVPVLEQIEKDFTNEEFQNFNTRYKIPKKNSLLPENNTYDIGTKNDELSKKWNKERLESTYRHKEIYNDEKRLGNPCLQDKPGKQYVERHNKENSKESRYKEKYNDERRSGSPCLKDKPDNQYVEKHNKENGEESKYKEKYNGEKRSGNPCLKDKPDSQHLERPNKKNSEENKIIEEPCNGRTLSPQDNDNFYKDRDKNKKYRDRIPSTDHDYRDRCVIDRSRAREKFDSTRRKPIKKEYTTSRSPCHEHRLSNKGYKQERRKYSHSLSGEEECTRETDRIRSSDKTRTILYNRRDARSTSGDNKDICGEIQKYWSNSRDKRDDKNKSEDKELQGSRREVENSNRSDHCDKRLMQSSLTEKRYTRRYSERSASKDNRDTRRDEKKPFDLREKCPKRPRTVSRENDNKRYNSRSNSKERLSGKSLDSGREEDNIRNARYRYSAKYSVRNDQYDNLNNCKYKNRIRSNSRERPSNHNVRGFVNRDSKFKARDVEKMRERLLRHSVDREKHSLKGDIRGENKQLDKSSDKRYDRKSTFTNNETDSDLDDINLHLSGGSDSDSLPRKNTKECSNQQLNDKFEFLKHLGVDIKKISVDDLQRLVNNRQELLNGINQDDSDIEDHQLSDPEAELTDDEEHDYLPQIQKKNNVFQHHNDIEELDYEVSESEFTHRRCQRKGIKSKQDKYSRSIVKQNERHLKNVIVKKVEHEGFVNTIESDTRKLQTGFEARRREKSIEDRHPVKVARSKSVDFRHEKKSLCESKEKPESYRRWRSDISRKRQTQSLETADEERDGIPREIHDNGQEIRKVYDNMLKNIENCKQDCNTTRDEVSITRSKVTKDAELNEKRLSGDGTSMLEDGKGNDDVRTKLKVGKDKEKEAKLAASRKKEKITLSAYKARRHSFDSQIKEVDIEDSVNNDATNISEKLKKPETDVPRKDDLDAVVLDSKKKISVTRTEEDIHTSDKNVVTGQLSKVVEKLSKNSIDIPIKINSPITKEHVITGEVSNDVVEGPVNRPQLENYSCNDRDSFLHDLDLSPSEDEDNAQETVTSHNRDERSASVSQRKINILSNITIHNLSGISPPKNISKKSDGLSQEAETNPRKTKSPRHSRESSECLEEIREAVKNKFLRDGPSATSKSLEQFDTDELQKCLEEDGPKLSCKIVNYNAMSTAKKDIDSELCKTERGKKIHCEAQRNDEHVGQTKKKAHKIKKDEYINQTEKEMKQEHKKTSSSVIPSSKDQPVETDEDKFFKLFGPMTPSPCKALEDILEVNDRNKAKRNITKFQEIDNESFKVRDKNEDTEKNVLNKNENEKLGNAIETKNKNVNENKSLQIIITPDKLQERRYEPLRKIIEEKKKEFSNFSNNPTYIPNVRLTPKQVFDSPDHYIHRKNQENMKKTKQHLHENLFNRNLKLEDLDIAKHHLMEENCLKDENLEAIKIKESKSRKIIEKTSLTSSLEEDNVARKARLQKQKTKKKTSKKEEFLEREEDEQNIQIIKRERKKLKMNADDKKTRSSSFKIKIKMSKKRPDNSKKRRVLISDDSSDSLKESEKMKNKKHKVQEKNSDLPEEENDSCLETIKNLVKSESRKVVLNKKKETGKLKGTKRRIPMKAEEKKTQEKRAVKEEQNEKCKRNEDVKECNGAVEDTNCQENAKISDKTRKNLEDTSVSNFTRSNEGQEPVKRIKRITPKRIDDSSFSMEKEQKFQELKAKRELFIEGPESVINNARKRKHISDDGDDYRAEKHQRVTFIESTTTVEEDILDNAAHTQIKLQETKLNIEVEPNSSPLCHIEQTYDILSRKTAKRVANSQVEPTNVYPDITLNFDGSYKDIQVPITDNSLPVINLDTKDLTILGSMEKEIYYNLSQFSTTDILVGNCQTKSSDNKDSGEDNVAEKSDKRGDHLSFTNFLNTDTKTSTPIKNRPTGPHISKLSSVSETVALNSKPEFQKSITLAPQGSNTDTSTTGYSKALTNVSDCRTSSGMPNRVFDGNGVMRSHVNFSRTLKRDRRRPISVMVVD